MSHEMCSKFVGSSVTSIPAFAFYQRNKLSDVELCEDLVEIGECSFAWCHHSITKINIPNSLRRICDAAFAGSLQTTIRLHDGIESIGEEAFAFCIFTNFRVPPLITMIPDEMLYNCRSMLSLEIPEYLSGIELGAFRFCYCLQNVAFPPNTDYFGKNILYCEETTDIWQRWWLQDRAIWKLQHQIDGLPIHRLVHYQSYHRGALHNLILAVNSGSHQTLR